MTIEELREIALQEGVQDSHLLQTERELVSAIQKARGEIACFLTDIRISCAGTCEWRFECLKLVAEWRRR